MDECVKCIEKITKNWGSYYFGEIKIFSMKWNAILYDSAVKKHFHRYTIIKTECQLNKSGWYN